MRHILAALTAALLLAACGSQPPAPEQNPAGVEDRTPQLGQKGNAAAEAAHQIIDEPERSLPDRTFRSSEVRDNPADRRGASTRAKITIRDHLVPPMCSGSGQSSLHRPRHDLQARTEMRCHVV